MKSNKSILNKSTPSLKLIPIVAAAAIIMLGASNSHVSFAQTNSNNLAGVIDASISAIKGGDSNGAKKSLLQAESALEGNPKLSTAEKHVAS